MGLKPYALQDVNEQSFYPGYEFLADKCIENHLRAIGNAQASLETQVRELKICKRLLTELHRSIKKSRPGGHKFATQKAWKESLAFGRLDG